MSTLVTDQPPHVSRAVHAATWAAVGAAAAAGGWVAGLTLARSLLGAQLFARDLPADQLASTAVRLAGIGGVWGLLAGLAAGLVQPGDRGLSDRIAGTAMRAVGGLVVGLIGGALAPLAASFGRALPVEVSSALGWAFAGTLAGLVAYRSTRPKSRPGKTSSRQVGPTLGLAALAVASAFAATAGVLPEQGRWAAGGVALGAVAVLAALVAWVVAAQDRRMRELERTIREWEADDDEIATTIRPDPFNSP